MTADHRHDAAGLPERLRGTRRRHDRGDRAGVRRGTARRPHRSRPQPHGVHARRRARPARRRRCSPAPARRSTGSRSTCTTASTRASARSTSRRSSTSVASDRGAACAEALVLADRLGQELGLPVFLYGMLAGGRTRAELRRGGPAELARRIEAGELQARLRSAAAAPDRRRRARRRAAAAGRVQRRARRRPATLDQARAIAAAIREGGSRGPAGRPRDRALAGPRRPRAGLDQRRGLPSDASPADVVAAIVALAGRDAIREPSSSGWRRRPRSTASRPTSRSAAGRRSRTRWPDAPSTRKLKNADGPDQAQAPDQAPRQRRRTGHRTAGARASRRARRSARSRSANEARVTRLTKPPTWTSAALRSSLAAVFICIFLLVTTHKPATSVAVRRVRGRDLHPRRLLHRDVPVAPAHAQAGTADDVIDARMFTVGPVQENCYVVRRPNASDRGHRRPRRRGRPAPRGAAGARGRDGRGDPAHPHPLRPHRRGRAGGEGDRRARSTAPSSRPRCSPTSWPTCPGPGSARSRATTPTTRSRAARRSSSPA